VKKTLLALSAVAALAVGAPATVPAVAVAQAGGMSAADRAAVDRASSYLSGLTSARGRFVQTDANGATTQGTFYLQRPGKIRFEYDAPSRLLVVADGRQIHVHDPRLKTFRSMAQSSTPLSLFLGRTIDIDRSAVTSVSRNGNAFSINARDRRNPRSGYITLSFSGSPLQLREWTVVDPQNRRTRVRITSMTKTAGFPASLFSARPT
jgi:outer membrane lipoprotein-sorting protein